MANFYQIDYKGPCYNYFPWNGVATWADNVNSTTGAAVTTAVPSTNYYTVPFDCFVNYWAPNVTWISSTSYTGRLDTSPPSVATPSYTTRVYTGDVVSGDPPVTATYETFSTFVADNPLWVIALYKNPTNLNVPGTSLVSRTFSPVQPGVFGSFRFPNLGDTSSITSYTNTNSATSQLAAGDKLVCILYRDGDFCSTTGLVNGPARGFFLQQAFDLSFTLRLARR